MTDSDRDGGLSKRRDSMEETLLDNLRPQWDNGSLRVHEEAISPPTTGPPEPMRRFGDHMGYPLRRFIFRGIIGVIVPPILLVYYILMWVIYLPSDDPRLVDQFGPRGGQYVFYGWFLIGIVGLNLSKFGLTGIEATMLMTPFWGLKNAMQLMAHAEHTWSGPSGWLKFVQTIVSRERTTMMPSRLWILLALLSSLLFVSLPASGLVFELGDGFTQRRTHPEVVGFRYDNINARISGDVTDGARLAWGLAVPARIPGTGTIYTPAQASRNASTYATLRQLKAALPFNDGVNDIFLTQQAETPVLGRSWGVLMRYNCSTVSKLAEFPILSKRNTSEEIAPGLNQRAYFTDKSHSKWINLYNYTLVDIEDTINYQAYFEIGYDRWPFGGAEYINPSIGISPWPFCYLNASHKPVHSYLGLDVEQTIDIALMQRLTPLPGYVQTPMVPPNSTLSGAIPELENQHLKTFNAYQNFSGPVETIGVTCTSSSAVGTAEVDGRFATFERFEATDSPIPANPLQCAKQLHYGVADTLSSAFTQSDSRLAIDALYTSFGGQRAQQLQTPDFETEGYFARLSLVQPENLRLAMLRSYAAYAVQLMFDGGQGVNFGTNIDSYKFVHENLTEFDGHKTVERGVVPPIVPAIMLAVWAAISVALTMVYGFRRRWAETLDGYSTFRFGADLSDTVKHNADFAVVKGFEETKALLSLPGFVGDAQPGFSPGHISLVNRGVAPKRKAYL